MQYSGNVGNHLKLPWLYLTVKITNAVNFYINKYPKVLSLCDFTPSNSQGNYWQKKSKNIHVCDPHKSRCIKCKNRYIDEGHGNLFLSLS